MWDPWTRKWTSLLSTGGQQTESQIGTDSPDYLELPVPGRYHFLSENNEAVAATSKVIFSCPTGTFGNRCLWKAYHGTGTYSLVAATGGGFGQWGDVPVPLDVTGDGVAEPAIYRPWLRCTDPANCDNSLDPDRGAWRVLRKWRLRVRIGPIKVKKLVGVEFGFLGVTVDLGWFGWPVTYRFPGATPTCANGNTTPLAADLTGDGRDDLIQVCPHEVSGQTVLKWVVWPYPFTADPGSLITFYHGEWGDVPLILRKGDPQAYPAYWRPRPSAEAGYCHLGWYDHIAGVPGGTAEFDYPASSAGVPGTFDYRCGVPILADTQVPGTDSLVVYRRADHKFYRKDLFPQQMPTVLVADVGDGTGYAIGR